MARAIQQKITGFKVKTDEGDTVKTPDIQVEKSPEDVVVMHESVERPEMLVGSTYKVKTPVTEHAMYITINDIILNEGTAHEQRRPFEVFINSKNMDNFQWVVALTRLMSAVFRKGGEVTFMVEELKAVFDPKGGYFKPGGIFMPSVVAEIGHAIERHLKTIGLIEDPELHEHQRAFIESKKAELRAAGDDICNETDYPADCTVCDSCGVKAVSKQGGCEVCLGCGASTCHG